MGGGQLRRHLLTGTLHRYGLSVSPAVLAAAAATRTRRVRIGLAAAILPFHDPIRLAEELAIVDILSEGRLDVGVGRGNRPVEFEGYRVPQIENRERFEECLAIMLKAWTLERFAFEGRHFKIPEVRVIPKPLQRPHPPVYVVCTSPDTIEATALRGAPMLNSLLRGGPEQLAKSRDTYIKACEKAGRSADEIASLLGRWGVSRHIYVAPTDAQALAEAKDAEMWYQESLRRFLIPERIDRVHPLLQPGFRALEERFAHVSYEAARGGERRLRIPRHGGRAGRGIPAARRRRDALLDELRRLTSGSRPPLDGALCQRSDAAFSGRERFRCRRRRSLMPPRYGNLNVADWQKAAATINGYKTEPWLLKGAQILSINIEVDDDPADKVIAAYRASTTAQTQATAAPSVASADGISVPDDSSGRRFAVT
jgi:alkanesulfonate monooxygenase SsuD/methylene tetrahydromethanopterin reductase-like flavin-dependent oxidoreductase (luciferase family)